MEPNNSERADVDELLAERYDRREREAFERLTAPAPVSIELSQTIDPATGVTIDRTPEGSARGAERAAKLPRVNALRENLQEPSLRGAVNSVLRTLTGDVLSVDEIDAHLAAQVGGKESPLATKLKSTESLKLFDPVGNVAEAFARENAQRQGLAPELVEKTAQTFGLLAGVLTPGGAALKGARVMARSAKARRLANEIYMNSLFSGPATHATNITANALVSAWIVPERFLAASADALRYGVTLGKTQREVYFGESGAMAFGMMSSLTDAIRESLRAFRTGQSKIGPSIMEEVSPSKFRYGPEGLRRIEAEETFVGEGLGFWSTLWRSPTRALGAEDAFFKTINYNAEAYAIAYREAARSGDLSVSNIKRFLDNPSSEAVTRAREFAVITTFQREIDELGGGFISKVGGVGQGIQDMPMGRVLAPVLRTPTNLAHFATERTPVLGMLSRTWRADIAAGGARRANAIAKQAGGATLAASFAYFGMSDIVTGGGPTDPTLRRNLQELTGWQPYSIRIGDTYYSYDRLEPLGAMLGLMADFTEIAGQLPEWQATEFGQAVGLAVSRNLMDGRFLDGLTDLFDALAGDSHALERLGKGILQRTTPAGGALRAVTKAIDPVRRETDPGANPEKGEWGEVRHILNQYRAQVPGYSTELPPRRNLWGDAIVVPKGFGPDWLSPVFTSTAKRDPAGDEIVRLGRLGLLTMGRHARVILGSDPETHPIDKPPSPLATGVELTDVEYDDYQSLAVNEWKDAEGMGLRERVTHLVTKDKEFKDASDALRATIITRTVTAHRRGALAALLEKHPGLLQIWEKRTETKSRALAEPRVEGSGTRGRPSIGIGPR